MNHSEKATGRRAYVSSSRPTENSADGLSTQVLSDALDLRPQSIRKRYSETGSYFGIRPVKLPNGRLRWPADAVDQLLNGGGK